MDDETEMKLLKSASKIKDSTRRRPVPNVGSSRMMNTEENVISSRARKSLDFGTAPVTNHDEAKYDNTLLTTLFLSNSVSLHDMVSPNPQPPKNSLPHNVQQCRRSKRLVTKSQLGRIEGVNTEILYNPSSFSRQNICDSTLHYDLSHFGSSVDCNSDYGTSSEKSSSTYSGPIKRRINSCTVSTAPNRPKRKKLHEDSSSDYATDNDHYRNSPSPSTEILPWDPDEPVSAQNWPDATSENAFLNISDLSSVDFRVVLLKSNGAYAVVPMQGYELPPTVKQTVPQYSTTEMRRRRRLGLSLKCPFSINSLNEVVMIQDAFLKQGFRVIAASEVISLEPSDTRFCELYPVLVSIPLFETPSDGDKIYCLSSLDPDPYSHPCNSWTVEECNISVVNGRITFRTLQFCKFVIVIRERPIDAQKQIRGRIGGNLYVQEIPWIQVRFPSFQDDFVAKVSVFLDTELCLPEYLSWRRMDNQVALACPILLLEPHNRDFIPETVTIQLPVPDYAEILRLFPNAKLVIWQSCTAKHEPPIWERLDVIYELSRLRHIANQEMWTISFKVTHFSFFRVVWDLISDSLYVARVSMSYFSTFVSFSMMCQATMEEADNNCFGLEVTCYRSDKTIAEPTNYRHKVGGLCKPKSIRPGRIFVMLKSSCFEADQDAGEDPDLIKEGEYFRGKDFEVQYCCRFKEGKSRSRGPIGKVIVNRGSGKKGSQLLFEFNIQKSGHEGEKTPVTDSDRWSIIALQELATGLHILQDDNWKKFAQQIGFTKEEIRKNFQNSPNQFPAIVGAYQHRGGTPDEFVKALYTFNRDLNINLTDGYKTGSRKPNSSGGSSSGRGSNNFLDPIVNFGSDSDTSGVTQISQDSLLSAPTKKRPHSGSKPNSNPSSRTKRRKTSTKSESTSDDEGSDSEEKQNVLKYDTPTIAKSESSSIERRNDLMRLECGFLWDITKLMTAPNWKSLGRNLGLEESCLLNIEQNHRLAGLREQYYQLLIAWKEKFPKKCTFGTLYAALRKENMNSVAKGMMSVKRND